MGHPARYCLLAIVLLLAVSGCVRESTDGPTRTFTYELWVPFSVLLGGLAAVPAGWLLRDTSARFGWALLIAGPLVAFMFAPSLFQDRAVVDEAGFSLRTGIWGLTAVHAVSFEDLKRVSVVYEESRGRRGRKTIKCYLLCELDEGGSAKIPINNDVSKAAAPHFLKAAEARGIPVLDAS